MEITRSRVPSLSDLPTRGRRRSVLVLDDTPHHGPLGIHIIGTPVIDRAISFATVISYRRTGRNARLPD